VLGDLPLRGYQQLLDARIGRRGSARTGIRWPGAGVGLGARPGLGLWPGIGARPAIREAAAGAPVEVRALGRAGTGTRTGRYLTPVPAAEAGVGAGRGIGTWTWTGPWPAIEIGTRP
jgi:hypothetical protein